MTEIPSGRSKIPRWLMVSGIVVVALALLGVGVMALSASGHRPGPPPGGHQPSGGDSSASAESAGAASGQACETEPIAHEGGSGATLTCANAEGAGETSETFTCRNPQFVGLQVDPDIEAGEFTVTVKDAAGTTAFSETYRGTDSDSANLRGQDGAWEITATRAAGFAGGFTVQIYCGSH